MNLEIFSIGTLKKYDVNVLRAHSPDRIAIQTSRVRYVLGEDQIVLYLESHRSRDIKKFYKKFNDLENKIWEKTESALRAEYKNLNTDDMMSNSIKINMSDLDTPPHIVLGLNCQQRSLLKDLPEEGVAIFLLAFDFIEITQTSAKCYWWIPKFLIPQPKPVEEPYVEPSLSDIGDIEEEDDFLPNKMAQME